MAAHAINIERPIPRAGKGRKGSFAAVSNLRLIGQKWTPGLMQTDELEESSQVEKVRILLAEYTGVRKEVSDPDLVSLVCDPSGSPWLGDRQLKRPGVLAGNHDHSVARSHCSIRAVPGRAAHRRSFAADRAYINARAGETLLT